MGKMLDAGSEGMNPFRLLYNLEVLSGRLNVHSSPSSMDQSDKFVTDFLGRYSVLSGVSGYWTVIQ